MSQAVVQNPGAKTNVKIREWPAGLQSDSGVLVHLYSRAEKVSTLRSMSITCTGWNKFSVPVFASLKELAWDYYQGVPKSEPKTIFGKEKALKFALAYILPRISNRARNELPEHVIMLGCSFTHILGELTPKDRKEHVVRYVHLLRGLTKARWAEVMNLLAEPNEKAMLRLAAISSPDAARIFAYPEDIEEERKQLVLDLAAARKEQKLYGLISTSYSWARNYDTKTLPEALFHALPAENFRLYWDDCKNSFEAETIIALLKQPLPDHRRSDLMDDLLGLSGDGLSLRKLPRGSEPEILGLVNDWLKEMPAGCEAKVLKHMAYRIEQKEFDLTKSFEQLGGLVIHAYGRKKLKCQHAARFLKAIAENDILSSHELKEAKKMAKLLY